DGFHLVQKITRQAAILVEEVAPVPPVVPADPEVGPDPQYLVHVANRGGDFMNEPLVLEEDYLGFPVWVIVILPALGFHVVFQHAAAPHRQVNPVRGRGHVVRPDLVHGRIAFVIEAPFPGAGIEPAGARGGGHPDELTLYGDAINHVVRQAAVELRERVEAAGRVAAEAAHGGDPEVVGLLIERQIQHGAMGQPIGGPEDLPLAFFVERQSVVGAGPDAIAIHAYAVHAVVGQALRSGEVFPAIPGHVLGKKPGRGEEREEGNSHANRSLTFAARMAVAAPPCFQSRDRQGAVAGDWIRVFHSVFTYSIRSFNSSLVRSLLTPCVSYGLKTVQISSRVRAEPSWR